MLEILESKPFSLARFLGLTPRRDSAQSSTELAVGGLSRPAGSTGVTQEIVADSSTHGGVGER